MIYPEKLLASHFDGVKFTVGLNDDGTFMLTNKNVETDVPDFYRMRVEVFTSPQSKVIGEIWLPLAWNERLLGHGNGGLGSKVNFHRLVQYVRRGYAVWNSDLSTSEGDFSGCDNPDVIVDYGWRANQKMTELAKRVIEIFYGKKPKYSYFFGESTGGNQAMCFPTRFPDAYDGVVAGVPAMNRIGLTYYILWVQQCMHQADGSPLFTDEQIDAISYRGADFFTARGVGEAGDDFVTLPDGSDETIRDFIAFLRDKMPELNDVQLSALQKMYWGPHDDVTGERLFPGVSIGSEVTHSGMRVWRKGRYLTYIFNWAFGKDRKIWDMNYSTDRPALEALRADLDNNSTDLTAFRDHGGKLLMYAGASDAVIPFGDSLAYYQTVLDEMGGYDKVGDFFRYFILPGRGHTVYCRGSNEELDAEGRDYLDMMVRWVEDGVAPDGIYAIGYHGTDPLTDTMHKENGVKFKRLVKPVGSP